MHASGAAESALLNGSEAALGTATVAVVSSPHRFVALAVFTLFGLSNQFQYISNAPIVDQLAPFLECTAAEVNLFALVFPLVFAVGCFPACAAFSRIGLRDGLLIGLAANAAGAFVKFAAVRWHAKLWLMLVGQFVAAVGQLFMLPVPPLLAVTWFPTTERTAATAVGSIAAFLGPALSFVIAPAVVNVHHNRQADFAALFAGQLGVAAAALVLCLVLVPRLPRHPPSTTSPQYLAAAKHGGRDAEHQPDDASAGLSILSHLWSLRRNGGFWAIVIVFGVGAGAPLAVGAVFAQFSQAYGVGERASGLVVFVSMLASVVSCFGIGPILDRYRRYRIPLAALYTVVALLFVGLAVVLRSMATDASALPMLYAFILPLMMAASPQYPAGLEFAVELTYPLPEEVAATVCTFSAQVFAFLATLGGAAVFGNHATRDKGQALLLALGACMLACAFVIVAFVREDRHRYDAECAREAVAAAISSSADDLRPDDFNNHTTSNVTRDGISCNGGVA